LRIYANSNTGGGVKSWFFIYHKWDFYIGYNFFCDGSQLFFRGYIFEQTGKFIAAQAHNCIAVSRAGLKAFAKLYQGYIADVMPIGVVNGFEVV
jgi:hypothetical protein